MHPFLFHHDMFRRAVATRQAKARHLSDSHLTDTRMKGALARPRKETFLMLSFANVPHRFSLWDQTLRLGQRFPAAVQAIMARLSQTGLPPARLFRRIDAAARPLPTCPREQEAGQ